MKDLINNFNYGFQFFENYNFLEMIELNYNFQVNIDNFKLINSTTIAKQILLCSLLSFETKKNIQINIKFINETESKILNNTFRYKNSSTNIISFENDKNIQKMGEFGDLAICLPIIEKESIEQNKTFINHLSHLVIHGCLHLQGLEHNTKEKAAKMEDKEINILKYLEIENPYLI